MQTEPGRFARWCLRWWPLVMLAVVAAMALPYWVAGQSSYFMLSDNLDSNAVWYTVAARYFGLPGNTPVAEMMNGVPLASIRSTDWVTQLAFRFFSPLTAYLTVQTVNVAVAFAGMFGLVVQLAGRRWAPAALGSATLFAALPFITVYAASTMGTALAACALVALWKDDSTRRGRVLWYVCVVYYGLTANLVLVGYAVLCLCAVALCVALVRRRLREKRRFLFAVVGLGVLFAAQNFAMITQFLGLGGAEVSHRAEFVLEGIPKEELPAAVLQLFFGGQYHAASLHLVIAVAALVILAAAWLLRGRFGKEEKRLLRIGLLLLGICAGVALFYGAFWSGPVVSLRRMLGTLGSFQFDRFYMLYPTLWYALLGVCLALLGALGGLWDGRRLRAAGMGAAALLLCGSLLYETTGMTYYKETLKAALGVPQQTGDISWGQFYDPALFDEVETLIGAPRTAYQVGSVGIHPGVAQMNGFSCIDGYCPDYPLRYKHAFRTVIAGELYRSQSLQTYFDGWGSRCYLFLAETGNMLSYKTTQPRRVEEMWLDVDAFRALGGQYLVSAVELGNADALGLRLLGVCTRPDSVWELYVYEAP